MAYILIVVGLVMAGSGLGTVAYSSLVARFDEYWTSLTVGATLIAGGVVTIGLGLVIRTLLDLKAVLMAQPVASKPIDAAEAPDAPQIPSLHDLALPDREPTTEDLPRRDPPAPVLADKPHPLRPPRIASPREPAPLVTAPEPATAHEPTSAHDLVSAHQDVVLADEIGHAHGHETTPPLGATGHVSPVEAPVPPPAIVHPADDYQLETPSTAAHDLPKTEPVGSRDARHLSDDWLERAFAELDEELPLNRAAHKSGDAIVEQEPPAKNEAARTEPAKTEIAKPQAAELEPVMPMPEPVHSDAEAPQEALTLQPQPDAPAVRQDSAVIGRYEADGTSYVMFADGSIEAQSSAGVYRFGSMAELKAFIET